MDHEAAKAAEGRKAEPGVPFSPDKINLAELAQRTGIPRKRLRRMKAHDFKDTQNAAKGRSLL